jgi:hypothetical protein
VFDPRTAHFREAVRKADSRLAAFFAVCPRPVMSDLQSLPWLRLEFGSEAMLGWGAWGRHGLTAVTALGPTSPPDPVRRRPGTNGRAQTREGGVK